MIIDFHTHTFPKKIVVSTIDFLSKKAHMSPSLDGTEEGLLRSMEESNVDYCVEFSVATNEKQVSKINDIAISKSLSDKIIHFGAMHPDFEDYEKELIRIKEGGIKGIKIHPVYQDTNLSNDKYLSIFKVCSELGLIVLTHSGFDVGFPGVDLCGPKEARRVKDKFPNLKLVLAHMGGWKQWEEVINVLKDLDVYFDTSFTFGRINTIIGENYYKKSESDLMNKEMFMKMIDILGYERILYGTDSPWTDHKETIEFIRDLRLPEEETTSILGLNAKKLLNL